MEATHFCPISRYNVKLGKTYKQLAWQWLLVSLANLLLACRFSMAFFLPTNFQIFFTSLIFDPVESAAGFRNSP